MYSGHKEVINFAVAETFELKNQNAKFESVSFFGSAIMFNPKALGRILITAFKWAIVWGLVGAAMGVLATTLEPDTGHIPRNLVPLMMAVPSAVFGAIAGLIFASVLTAVHVSDFLGPRGRVVLGTVIGATAGIVFMNLLAHSVITIILAAFLGAALAARFARSEAPAEKK